MTVAQLAEKMAGSWDLILVETSGNEMVSLQVEWMVEHWVVHWAEQLVGMKD